MPWQPQIMNMIYILSKITNRKQKEPLHVHAWTGSWALVFQNVIIAYELNTGMMQKISKGSAILTKQRGRKHQNSEGVYWLADELTRPSAHAMSASKRVWTHAPFWDFSCSQSEVDSEAFWDT